jgi:hypothetical protein
MSVPVYGEGKGGVAYGFTDLKTHWYQRRHAFSRPGTLPEKSDSGTAGWSQGLGDRKLKPQLERRIPD